MREQEVFHNAEAQVGGGVHFLNVHYAHPRSRQALRVRLSSRAFLLSLVALAPLHALPVADKGDDGLEALLLAVAGSSKRF